MSHLLARLKQLKKSILQRRIVKLDHSLCNACSNKLHKEFGVKGGGKSHKMSKKLKTKRKMKISKKEFLARMNRGRKKAGLKPIHAKR